MQEEPGADSARYLDMARRVALRRLNRAAHWRGLLDALYLLGNTAVGALFTWVLCELAFLGAINDETTTDLHDALVRLACAIPGGLAAGLIARAYMLRMKPRLVAQYSANIVDGGLLELARQTVLAAVPSGGLREAKLRRLARNFTGLYRIYRKLCRTRGMKALPACPNVIDNAAAVAEWLLPFLALVFPLTLDLGGRAQCGISSSPSCPPYCWCWPMCW
jgi:hypothetical protein